MLRSFPNSVLLFLDAPPHIRYKRVIKRGEKGEAGISFDEFLKSEQRGTEKGLSEIKRLADYVIINDGTSAELQERVDDIVKSRL